MAEIPNPGSASVQDMIAAFMHGLSVKQMRQDYETKAESAKQRAEKHKADMEEAQLLAKLHMITAKKGVLDILGEQPSPEGGTAPMDFKFPEMGIDQSIPHPLDLLTKLALAAHQKKQEAEATRQANRVDLPPQVSEMFGIPGVDSVDKEVMAKLEPSLTLPSEMGGGAPGAPPPRVGKSQAGLMETVFKEKKAGERSSATNATTLEAARIRAAHDSKNLTDEDRAMVPTYANQVATGQIKVSEVPGVALKKAVLAHMGMGDIAVPSKALLDKMDQYTPAIAAVAKIEGTLKTYMDPNTPAIKRAEALAQFDTERNALSRHVGRNFGEKGVFTDQDKKDFARLLAPGTMATAIFPSFARNRLNELKKLVDDIKTREFEQFQDRTGAKLAFPNPAAPKAPKTYKHYAKNAKGDLQGSDDGLTWTPVTP